MSQKDSLNIAYNQIDKLQYQLDSLKQSQVYEKLAYKVSDHSELITQVNDFYDSAWIKLLYTIGIVGAVVGIFIPLVISWFQNRNLKKEILSLENELKDKFNNIIEEKVRELSQKIEESSILSIANSMYSTAVAQFSAKNYNDSFGNFMQSCFDYLYLKRENDITAALKRIKEVLNKIDKNGFYKVEEVLKNRKKDSSFNAFKYEIEKSNIENYKISLLIKEIDDIIITIKQ